MASGLVVPELGSDREPLEGIQRSAFQLRHALPNALLEYLVLIVELAVESSGLQEVADPQQHLIEVEGLGDEILGARGQDAAASIRGGVTGQHQDGEKGPGWG